MRPEAGPTTSSEQKLAPLNGHVESQASSSGRACCVGRGRITRSLPLSRGSQGPCPTMQQGIHVPEFLNVQDTARSPGLALGCVCCRNALQCSHLLRQAQGHDVNINEHQRSRSGGVWRPHVIGHTRAAYPEGFNASLWIQHGTAPLTGMDCVVLLLLLPL